MSVLKFALQITHMQYICEEEEEFYMTAFSRKQLMYGAWRTGHR